MKDQVGELEEFEEYAKYVLQTCVWEVREWLAVALVFEVEQQEMMHPIHGCSGLWMHMEEEVDFIEAYHPSSRGKKIANGDLVPRTGGGELGAKSMDGGENIHRTERVERKK